jgi:hypothetical protein
MEQPTLQCHSFIIHPNRPYLCGMGKRTIRIPRSKISTELDRLQGRAVQVITLDGLTHCGVVLSADQNRIVLEDGNASWTSKKRHRRELQVAQIYYIAYEIISAW